MKRKISFHSVFNVITSVILAVLVVIVVLIFITRASGKVPSLFGYTVFRVQTDSMEPTLLIGDIIIDKKVNPEEIHKDDIITYDCLTGVLAGQTVTHRVVDEPDFRDGTYYFRTQGDKPGANLDAEISYDQVEGKYLNKLTWLNGLYAFFLSPYGLIVFILIILVLFGYEMIALITSYRSINEKDDDYYAPKAKKPSKKRKK